MTTTQERIEHDVKELDRVTIRFAGDSGDGMQLTGTQFTRTAAVFGNDISTFPDYPAEIRAPAGSLPGVSGFQISFSASDIHTPGDAGARWTMRGQASWSPARRFSARPTSPAAYLDLCGTAAPTLSER